MPPVWTDRYASAMHRVSKCVCSRRGMQVSAMRGGKEAGVEVRQSSSGNTLASGICKEGKNYQISQEPTGRAHRMK